MRALLALAGVVVCLVGATALGRRHAERSVGASAPPGALAAAPDPDARAARAIVAFGDTLGAHSSPLPPDTLAWIAARYADCACGPQERVAAARALARFGGRVERRQMLALLRDPLAGAERELAAAGLAAARDEDTAAGLAEAIDGALDPRAVELAAQALSGVLANVRPTDFSPYVLQSLETTLSGMVEHPASGAAARRHGLSALASLGGSAARAALLRVLRRAQHEPELARAAAAELARMEDGFHVSALADAMLDPHLPEATRDLAALELCRHPQRAGPAVLDLSVARVQRLAERDPSPIARVGALETLAASGASAALATLAHAAWSDADPGVRSAAVLGLAHADEQGEWNHVLGAVSREDPAPEVRALALAALAERELRYALK